MDAKWMETFEDFGQDPYLPFARDSILRIESPSANNISYADRLVFLKREVAQLVARRPGVYGMIDELGRLIYVGKSKSLRNRLLSYFMPNNEDEKSGRIVQSAVSIVWEYQPNELSALLREQWLIRAWLPRMNVMGMPNRQQQAFLCIGKPPGESIYLSKYFDSTARFSVGPLAGVGALHRAVEILSRHFRLRDCSLKTPMYLTDQLSLFDLEQRAGCIREELGNCLAPCTIGCNRATYQEHVLQAVRFLQGDGSPVVESFELAMHQAASGHHYEHASRLRDDWKIIKWLTRRLGQFTRARSQGPTLYCLAADSGPPIWYLLRHGGVIAVVLQPSLAKDWQRIMPQMNSWRNRIGTVGRGELPPEDTMGLITTWLQKHGKPATAKEAPVELSWTANSVEVPTAWKDAKEWIRTKSQLARERCELQRVKSGG
jgi:excinuclease ABC subunit C